MADITALKKQRSVNKGRLTFIMNSIKKSANDITLEECRAKLARTEKLMEEFTAIENQIFVVDHTQESDMEYEENYYKVVTELSVLMRKLGLNAVKSHGSFDNSANITHTGNTEVRLPKLNIPPFSGDYKEWQSFYDLYLATIHDSHSLSPVQKFQYLKGLLRGEAASLLRHLSITEANYIEALQKLRQRYDRKKHTITSFIRTFIEQPTISTASSTNIKRLLDTSDEVLRGLKAVGPCGESKDPWLIYILVNKLDEESKTLWAQLTAEKEIPTIQEFFEFLLRRGDALESLKGSARRSTTKEQPIKGYIASNILSCGVCNDAEHMTYQCPKFMSMELEDRRNWAKNENRCFNCLRGDHGVFKCRSKKRCNLCNRKHHTLLHSDQARPLATARHISVNDEEVRPTEPSSVNCAYASNRVLHTVLPTAVVNVVTGNGKIFPCRALLDSGSQASFITESCLQMLNVKRKNARISVSGLGNSRAEITRGIAELKLQTKDTLQPHIILEALVLPNITTNLPTYGIDRSKVEAPNLRGIPLADPDTLKPKKIDMLIGAEHFFQILEKEQIKNEANKIVLQNTVFGWVVVGQIAKHSEILDVQTYCSRTIDETTDNIDQTLRRFWEVEEIETSTSLSIEEQFCENHFKANTTHADDGRYIVRLPFKENKDQLGESLHIAIRRLQTMERKFQRDSELYEEYAAFMQEYEKLGHMKQIESTEKERFGVYLPHHGVLKQSSTTTKLRVVFDASSKTGTGVSLNDCLAVGPTIQSSLTQILLRFREHAVVFAADVEKMYRQVWVNKDDSNYQRIVWRNHPSEPIRHYQLVTATYGTSSAPFLATRALRDVGLQLLDKNPEVANAIINDFYVDDLLSGCETVDAAVQLKRGIDAALKKKGFHLRKWISNSVELNEEIREKDVQITDKSNFTKVLGLHWNPSEDKFYFQVNIEDTVTITKRKVLSNASRIFDPLGLLAPIVIQIKIFIQQLWISNLDWDEPLKDDLLVRWKTIYNNLQGVPELSIPRFIGSSKPSCIELHGFSDASEQAYAAVVYTRTKLHNGQVIVNLISSKTKVAPIKQISIPRLELCGAVLLTKLINSIVQNSTLQIDNTIAWTDSKIVLDWLSSPPRRWKTFVANRTSEIIDSLPRDNWRYIRSVDNPADCASRGLCPKILKEFELWWKGPTWLSLDKTKWPLPKFNTEIPSEELRRQVFNTHINENSNLVDEISERISSFHKITRLIAYIQRFAKNCRTPKQARHTDNIFSRDEVITAKNFIIKAEQGKYFNDEIKQLTVTGNLSTSSNLKSLTPFIDKNGVLRVGGRLSNSNATYDAKHPVILPYESKISMRIVEEAHQEYKHAGASLLLANLRQHFWILGVKKIIRKTIFKCVVCAKIKAKTEVQIMADLPAARTEFIRPFLKVGVDFAGPIQIHLTKGRGQKIYKSYICLFICLSVKAIHIELVGDLSSESFLAALKRFVSRRGICTDIFSDNGTNFS